jgi:hypothetical protein
MVAIRRIDIITDVMTTSAFRVAPRQGHLERLSRIHGYLSKICHTAICIRTEEPDFSDLLVIENEWSRSVYGVVNEVVPTDDREPLGIHVTKTHYFDANLLHCLIMGSSVTTCLHMLNKN